MEHHASNTANKQGADNQPDHHQAERFDRFDLGYVFDTIEIPDHLPAMFFLSVRFFHFSPSLVVCVILSDLAVRQT